MLVLVVYGRARQQDVEADLREEGQPNRQQVLEPVHQQPHGAAAARGSKRPRGRSSVTAALALGARGSSRGTARTAARPRRPQMRSDSSEVMARIGLS